MTIAAPDGRASSPNRISKQPGIGSNSIRVHMALTVISGLRRCSKHRYTRCSTSSTPRVLPDDYCAGCRLRSECIEPPAPSPPVDPNAGSIGEMAVDILPTNVDTGVEIRVVTVRSAQIVGADREADTGRRTERRHRGVGGLGGWTRTRPWVYLT